ncbi:hypothetical protein [Streptomyces scabiei]|uniref:hypothetical protein n=1 Tax=Streptomyces scabiei TaxID=1930 RepID=UPI0029BD4D3F|nr:hypothetical protein [Streptomyces scabiei]MDX3279069.1 hypothetical protein [Streptomyces scabiei]MDX3279078.1 hypothetical protein [Streptomyces scabiei]
MKKLISRIRQITWKQWLVLALYGATLWGLIRGGSYVVGLMASDKTSSIPDAAKYGFTLGILFAFLLLAVRDSFTHIARRTGRKASSEAATE